MNVFPEKDKLKIGQCKAGIEKLVLWSRFIFCKLHLPLGGIQRRHRSRDDIPFRNGETGARQTGNSAQNDLYQQHDDACIDPDGHRAGCISPMRRDAFGAQ